jgi:ATP-binding cassette subfamily B protein
MILVSFAEILSIGAVLPFLGALTAPDQLFGHSSVQPIIRLLGISSPDQLLLPITIAFSMTALIAGAMRLLLLWANTRLSFATGADISISMYRRTLFQPYAVHLARNSSEVINGISNKASVVTNTILMGFNIISSIFAIVAILMTLLSVDPIIALATFSGFGLIYGGTVGVTRGRLLLNSQRIADESTQVIKSLQEGLGAIRDILIDGSQDSYCQIYRNADLKVRRATGDSTFVASSPRYLVEALSMAFIAGIAYVIAQQADGIALGIPILGALALGAQRLLPLLQQVYSAWAGIKGNQASVQDAIDLLDQPLPADAGQIAEPLPYLQCISLHQLSFRYSLDNPWVLHNLDLTIPKGGRVGFIGATGSGKSTLLDIIMGLLQPTSGALAIDGQVITPGNCRAWQAHIAHVPQVIFLADSTIEENIAFGLPKDQIDHQRVRSAAQQAQIADVIETWPLKYQTFVGEHGIRLSGGQRQRIGIARALYKQADVIIFDEATSALDNETEQAVMEAIEGLSDHLTILIIAHRLTTLKNCNQIVELGSNGVVYTGTYQEVVIQASLNSMDREDEQQTELAASQKEYK